MIAVPVDKTRHPDPIISERFGDADYFLLFDKEGKHIGQLPNSTETNGEALSSYLATHGVKRVLFRHLGKKLYHWLAAQDIQTHAIPQEGTLVTDGVTALLLNSLPEVTNANSHLWLHPAGPGSRTTECTALH